MSLITQVNLLLFDSTIACHCSHLSSEFIKRQSGWALTPWSPGRSQPSMWNWLALWLKSREDRRGEDMEDIYIYIIYMYVRQEQQFRARFLLTFKSDLALPFPDSTDFLPFWGT